MRVFGLTISRQKTEKDLTPVNHGIWSWLWNVVREVWPGAWQQNVEVTVDSVLQHWAVYACVTLIASDIAKNRVKLVEFVGPEGQEIWREIENPAFSPVLRKPNHYQNRIKFIEWWITSKLLHGNTYVLKQRDRRNVVTGLYVLDPHRVEVLVADNGEVFYKLKTDNLSRLDIARVIPGLEDGVVIAPASEIIHDIHVALFHPLVGVSPIFACGLAALQGLKIQNNSYRFFANHSSPGGILVAPGPISEANAKAVKDYWNANFTGANVGKVAVLGDGLQYQPNSFVNARDSELIAQLKWTAENVCACFHVPPYKIGVGPIPSYNNVQALNLEYYQQALQNPIESIEEALDLGLGLAPDKIDGTRMGVEIDLEGLLRMDSKTLVEVEAAKIKAGFGKPNESRRKFDLPPVDGGDTPYMQQQNFSLAALDRRDKAGPPPSGVKPTTTPALPPGQPQLALPPARDAVVIEAQHVELLMTRAFEEGLLHVG